MGELLTAQMDPRNPSKGMREMEETHMLKHWGRRPSPLQIIHFQKQTNPPGPQGYLLLCNFTCSWWNRRLVWWRCQGFETGTLIWRAHSWKVSHPRLLTWEKAGGGKQQDWCFLLLTTYTSTFSKHAELQQVMFELRSLWGEVLSHRGKKS